MEESDHLSAFRMTRPSIATWPPPVDEVTEALVPVTYPQPVSASWTARALCLVADRSSPGVARNEILAMFPLGLQAPSR